MSITVVTPPATEPLDIFEAKSQLKVGHDFENTDIEFLITAARELAESFTRRAFITRTLDLKLPCFPGDAIFLPQPRLIAVSSITYVDTNGDSQTLSSSTYASDASHLPGIVYPAYNESWPSTRAQRQAVTVRYTAGYGSSASDVPGPIRAAIRLIVGHLYKHRSAVLTGSIDKEISLGARQLLWPYRFLGRADLGME